MEEHMNVGSTGKSPSLDNAALKKIIDAPEVDHIKHDLDSLGKNSKALLKNLKEDGSEIIRDRVEQLKASGRSELQRAEDFVKEKPAQGVAFGVVAGVVLSWLLGLGRK